MSARGRSLALAAATAAVTAAAGALVVVLLGPPRSAPPAPPPAPIAAAPEPTGTPPPPPAAAPVAPPAEAPPAPADRPAEPPAPAAAPSLPPADGRQPAVAAPSPAPAGSHQPAAASPLSPADAHRPAVAAAPAAPEAPAPEVRDVTPPGVTPPPAVTGPLERLPARAAAKPAEPVTRLLRPILVEDAGTLSAGGVRVKLPEIDAPDVDAVCRDKSGRDWPCGTRALAALRAFVRGRGLNCVVPREAREGTFVSACRLGATDVAEWLVRNGWARPKPGIERLAAAAAAARRERLGLWRDEAE